MALIGAGGGYLYYTQIRTEKSGSFSDRLNTFVGETARIATRSKAEWQLDLDPPRTWTDTSGRTLEGVLIDAERETALIRLLKNQRVYRIPFQRLVQADRTYLANWNSPSGTDQFYPAVPSRWPVMLGGAGGGVHVTKLPGGGGWRSENYDFLSSGAVDPSLIRELAYTCETLHRIAVQTPLPLGWGRPHKARRQLQIYSDRSEFARLGAQENFAAFYNPADNKIHFPLASMGVRGNGDVAKFDATRRKSFKVLVHELAHQKSVSLLVLDCPAWCGEGIAELFAAMQRAPGVFVFNNPQISVKRQFNYTTGLGDGAKLKRLPVPEIKDFLNISLGDFNRYTGKSFGNGVSYYCGSLLLVDYFCFADRNSLRPYMEAILTGVSPADAAEVHLLRGRNPETIESEIVGRWKSQGVQIVFERSPTVTIGDIEAKVGFTLGPLGGG